MQGLHDGHGGVIPTVLASVHAAAAPELAQRSLDAQAHMVRGDGDTGAAPHRKRNDAAVVREANRRLGAGIARSLQARRAHGPGRMEYRTPFSPTLRRSKMPLNQ